MSFLTRSKVNISETSFGFHPGTDDKTKRLVTPTAQIPNSFADSLEEFRQGLRQQLSDKLTIGSKYSATSPSNQKAQPIGLKDRFATTLLTNQRENTKRSENTHLEKGVSSVSGPISAKPSEKKFDFARELTKKLEERSPKRAQNKEVEQFPSFGARSKTPTPAPAELSSSFVGSLGTRDKSPLKSYALTIETKTPKGNKTSFLDDRFTSKTPQEKRETFVKILDRTPTAKTQLQGNSGFTGELVKSHSGFIQNLNQLRGSRATLQTQSPERKQELATTPTKNHCASLKTLSSFVSESFKRKEKETERSGDKMLTKKPSITNGFSEVNPSNGEKSPLGNRQSSSKLFGGESTTKLYGGVQDFFSATQDKGSYNRFFK